jgi:serine/threonine protein phosphatase PrpC
MRELKGFQLASTITSFRHGSEDRLAVQDVPGGLVVVVADGAGGMPGGGAAAELALKLVSDAVEYGTFDKFSSESWREVMIHLDAIVASDREAGETTMVVVAISDDCGVVGASVGDSGALVIGMDGTLKDLTESQHRKRRLGSGRALPVGFEGVLKGTLLVATDGILAFARLSTIVEVVLANDNLDEAATALVDRVRLPNGSLQDDVALMLVRRA